ncbi:MAG: DUF421 domain-containing protein [Oscillospiraceae bacterium]|nr:DUF421 domain-containing protein [Oscillospiraceae bacterium]
MAIVIIRTLILYLAIVVSMRVMGKRQLGELAPAELVVAVLMSDLAAHPLQDLGTPLIYGLVPVLTLLCCEILISGAILKFARLRTLICGQPGMIIKNGRIIQREMRKSRYTLDELAERLRKKDITDIGAVRYAILETDGTVSAFPYPEELPLTPRQMGIDVSAPGFPVPVICDGRVIDKNLKTLGRDRSWLGKRLAARGVKDARDVFLFSADGVGNEFFQRKEFPPK